MTNISYGGYTVSTTRGKKNYRIEFPYEDVIIHIEKEMVDEIAESTNVEYYYIALILAFIEYTRITTNAIQNKNPRMLKEDVLKEAICKILWCGEDCIENILISFRNLKWSEIKRIVQSSNPTESFSQYL